MQGLPAEMFEPEDYEVEPECWEAVCLFSRLMTQWRTGPAGIVGLDYGAARWLFSLYSVKNPRQLLEDLQIMEAEWLEMYREAMS